MSLSDPNTSNNTESKPKVGLHQGEGNYSFTQDKLLLEIGTNVMAPRDNSMYPAVIKSILASKNETFVDSIRVQFIDTKNSQIFARYQLEFTSYSDAYLRIRGRRQLCPGCTVEIQSHKKWMLSYIIGCQMLSNDKREKNVFLTVNSQHYHRSKTNKIRCPMDLLKLKENDDISVLIAFETGIFLWCSATIMAILKSKNESAKSPDLDIFKVCYRKDGILYSKYIHRFSASLALMDASFSRKCTVNGSDRIFVDGVTLYYYTMLVQKFSNHKQELGDGIVCLIIESVGCMYDMVMCIESRTFKHALPMRNSNLTPKGSAIHSEWIPNAKAVSFVPSAMKKPKSTKRSKLTSITEDPLWCVCLQNCKNPHQSTVIMDKKTLKQMKTENNTNQYKSEHVKEIQKRVHIGMKLSQIIPNCIKENVSNLFHYMVFIHAIQFNVVVCGSDDIKIFNYNFHDKITNNVLYGVALPCNFKGYKWKMENALYTETEIIRKWNLTKSCLPTWNAECLLSTSTDINIVDKIRSVIMNEHSFQKIINEETKWTGGKSKVAVYHEIKRKDSKIVWRLTQERFKTSIIQCHSNMREGNDMYLIPILIMNGVPWPHIEYLCIFQLAKDSEKVNVGLSFYWDSDTDSVRVGGIHVGKSYLLNQHELVDPNYNCHCLDILGKGGSWIIDDIKIGNPNDPQNRLNAMKNRLSGN